MNTGRVQLTLTIADATTLNHAIDDAHTLASGTGEDQYTERLEYIGFRLTRLVKTATRKAST